MSENEENDPIQKAEAIAKRIEEANKKSEELLMKSEQLIAKERLGGKSEAGQETSRDMEKKKQKQKDKEEAAKLSGGLLKPEQIPDDEAD